MESCYASGLSLLPTDGNETTNSGLGFVHHLGQFSQAYGEIHGYLSLVLCTFGIATNIINIIVLTKPKMRSAVNTILTGIAICDLGTMFSYLVYVLHFMLIHEPKCNPSIYTYQWMIFILWHMMISISLHSCSLWLAVLLALIRQLSLRSIKVYHQGSLLANQQFAWTLNAATFAVVLLFCVPSLTAHSIVEYPQYFEHTCDADSNVSKHAVAYTVASSQAALLANCTLMRAALWINGIVFKVIPCLLLAVLLGCLLYTLSSARKTRARLTGKLSGGKHHKTDRSTVMIICILVVFLVTELPQGVVAILSGIFTKDIHYYIYPKLGDLLDMFSLINSSVNFFLYCGMSSLYRRTFWQVILPAAFYENLRATWLLGSTNSRMMPLNTFIQQSCAAVHEEIHSVDNDSSGVWTSLNNSSKRKITGSS